MSEALMRLLFVVIVLALTSLSWAGRDGGGYYTAEKVANVRANVEEFDWAAAQRDAAVKRAERWLPLSEDDLWGLVPCQTLPRAIDVTMTKMPGGNLRLGCLNCGDEIFAHGNYPYVVDPAGAPW